MTILEQRTAEASSSLLEELETVPVVLVVLVVSAFSSFGKQLRALVDDEDDDAVRFCFLFVPRNGGEAFFFVQANFRSVDQGFLRQIRHCEYSYYSLLPLLKKSWARKFESEYLDIFRKGF